MLEKKNVGLEMAGRQARPKPIVAVRPLCAEATNKAPQ